MSDSTLQAVSTAIDLLQLATALQSSAAEATAELARRFAAKLDAGEKWEQADRDAFFTWLQARDDAASGQGASA